VTAWFDLRIGLSTLEESSGCSAAVYETCIAASFETAVVVRPSACVDADKARAGVDDGWMVVGRGAGRGGGLAEKYQAKEVLACHS